VFFDEPTVVLGKKKRSIFAGQVRRAAVPRHYNPSRRARPQGRRLR